MSNKLKSKLRAWIERKNAHFDGRVKQSVRNSMNLWAITIEGMKHEQAGQIFLSHLKDSAKSYVIQL